MRIMCPGKNIRCWIRVEYWEISGQSRKRNTGCFLGANWQCVDDFPLNQKVDVVVRPEDVILGEKGKGVVDGRIISSIFKGEDYSYELEVGKNEITCRDHAARLVGSEVPPIPLLA